MEEQTHRHYERKGYQAPLDPEWGSQWSLVRMTTILIVKIVVSNFFTVYLYVWYSHGQLNTGQLGSLPGQDLNVEPVWIQGITGEGVTVGIVDDGKIKIKLFEHGQA